MKCKHKKIELVLLEWKGLDEVKVTLECPTCKIKLKGFCKNYGD